MSKLAVVKRTLKKIGVEFNYEYDVNSELSSLSFKDAFGKEHKVVETIEYWNSCSPIVKVQIDDMRMDNQDDIRKWIINRVDLLTDADAYKAKKEAEEAHRAEIKRLTERKKFKFTYGKYELVVIKTLIGNISYRVATLDYPGYDSEYSPRLEVKFEGKHEDNPIVVISLGGSYGLDLLQAKNIQQELTGAMEALVAFQKIIDRESKIMLTDEK